MKIIKINKNNFTKTDVDFIVKELKQDKVLVLPTDTIYGLHCLANSKRAVNRIYKIKKRERDKPLLILVSSLTMLKKYCYVSKKQEAFLRKACLFSAKALDGIPKARGIRSVSVVLKSKGILPKEVSGGRDNLAARLPKSKFFITIIKRAGFPIISTSLNISGQRNIANIQNIDKYFKTSKPNLVIDAGESIRGKPSKLIDIRNISNNIKILRK